VTAVARDWVEPNVCTDENLAVSVDGLLKLAPWSVPRNVVDVMAKSTGDGKVTPYTALPGKLLIDQQVNWINASPLDAMVLIRVTRSTRYWQTSTPNAIQLRDRWTRDVDRQPDVPTVTGPHNSECGSAIDVGTNSVAEPKPGQHWLWQGAGTSDEWYPFPIRPGENLRLWYRCYLWTPPPWSDNANKNSPRHQAYARWTRIQMIAFPTQGKLVSG
jgi:hypothetical protein